MLEEGEEEKIGPQLQIEIQERIIFVAFVLISNLLINTRISALYRVFVAIESSTTIKQIKIH